MRRWPSTISMIVFETRHYYQVRITPHAQECHWKLEAVHSMLPASAALPDGPSPLPQNLIPDPLRPSCRVKPAAGTRGMPSTASGGGLSAAGHTPGTGRRRGGSNWTANSNLRPSPSTSERRRPPLRETCAPFSRSTRSARWRWADNCYPSSALRRKPKQRTQPLCTRLRGTAPGALDQEWRGITHYQQQRTPAGSGGEPHPGPSASSNEGPPTTTTSGPQPGEAGNRTQAPKPGVPRGHPPPPPPPDPSQEWRGTPPRHAPQTSGPQPGVAGNRTRDPEPGVVRDNPPPRAAGPSQEFPRKRTQAPQPGVARGHPPPPPPDPGQEWRGTSPRHAPQSS